MYDYNLLVSYTREGGYFAAKQEIKMLLKKLGEEKPVVAKTIASGIVGVKTSLDSRKVIEEIRELYATNPLEIAFTLKWVPVDNWCSAEMEEMKKVVAQIKDEIKPGERWAMEVEKRRFEKYHTQEIIKELAGLIEEKVDLERPDKILRVEIIDGFAGISVLKPREIFSTAKWQG